MSMQIGIYVHKAYNAGMTRTTSRDVDSAIKEPSNDKKRKQKGSSMPSLKVQERYCKRSNGKRLRVWGSVLDFVLKAERKRRWYVDYQRGLSSESASEATDHDGDRKSTR